MNGHADTIRTAFWYPRRGNIVEAERALDALLAENQRLRDALIRLEEACPDCGGIGCEWCGQSGHVFRDPAEMQKIRRDALAGDAE